MKVSTGMEVLFVVEFKNSIRCSTVLKLVLQNQRFPLYMGQNLSWMKKLNKFAKKFQKLPLPTPVSSVFELYI